ncbi:hypothetical protein ENROMM110B_22580 [Enterobacter rongchengensis]
MGWLICGFAIILAIWIVAIGFLLRGIARDRINIILEHKKDDGDDN